MAGPVQATAQIVGLYAIWPGARQR
jgi:hypothetical protein